MTPSHPDGRSSWKTSRQINTECTQGKFRKGVKPMKWRYLLNPPVAVGRVSLLAGYVAGETCSVYAIFFAHIMNPVSCRLVENNHKLRAIYGRYQEIYNWNGLFFTLTASLVVFVLAWCVVRGIAEAISTPTLIFCSTHAASTSVALKEVKLL
jgi:hypothetical protein